MKICLVVPWFPSLRRDSVESGQGIFEYRQAMKLTERGSEFKVISISWHGQADHEVISEQIEVYRLAPIFVFPKINYPIPNLIVLTRKIKQIAQDWKPNLVIYSHMVYLTACPIFRLTGKMEVASIVTTEALPGISWFYGNKIVDGIGYLYSKSIGKRMFKLGDGIQFTSSQLSKYIGKLNLDSKKTFLIPRGVDTEMFKPGSDRRRLKKELGIRESDTIVLYVGALDLVKGVNYLLQAAERILSNHNNIKFLIVGDGGLRQKYERLAKPLSQDIIFTGWRNDIPQLMNIADIFVLPSLSEGAANVAMEASASGLPVVATAVGEVPQIVSDGETGILVKPKDANQLAEAIEDLINNPSSAKKMAEAGRRRMEERYSWDIVCDKLQRAYQEVIDKFNASNCHLTG